MRTKGFLRILTAVLALMGAIGCRTRPPELGPKFGSEPDASKVSVYRFAIHALHNPDKLIKAYQPLVDYVNLRIEGGKIALEPSRDYASFEARYRAREPAFLLPNPWQTLEAMKHGYHVIAMAGDPKDFKGIFIVRKDSDLTVPSDLVGETVSYPAPTAIAACVMPQYYLHTHGVDVMRDISNRYVGSQESSIMNVYLGLTAAGATWPNPWRAFQREHPREAAELKVMWETDTLVNNSVMARDDVPEAFEHQVLKQLVELSGTPQGKAILKGIETAYFAPASAQDYDIARRYIERFEREVRPVEKP